ncbi:hypothetical protein K6L44_07065 [Gluconacetobacter entanii]|uniref:hypothetical protein n=1 Tax=Gluconacetobacter entanii TaxID=108528 RepID=UPI001C934147|nr:hypothetical protein [Gluconacetobacter entanii]MBY4639755.1 hypothetical protein [Gluconacetobacter entanii]MCW4579471.1 hypothetical protein [Gluconacetobacter entanii]MCW4582876.1 hypothetical protein [Gluconacetobacter entanii]MCW4586273.1 hypothetical protein [Gluconacetobacter entanii]
MSKNLITSGVAISGRHGDGFFVGADLIDWNEVRSLWIQKLGDGLQDFIPCAVFNDGSWLALRNDGLASQKAASVEEARKVCHRLGAIHDKAVRDSSRERPDGPSVTSETMSQGISADRLRQAPDGQLYGDETAVGIMLANKAYAASNTLLEAHANLAFFLSNIRQELLRDGRKTPAEIDKAILGMREGAAGRFGELFPGASLSLNDLGSALANRAFTAGETEDEFMAELASGIAVALAKCIDAGTPSPSAHAAAKAAMEAAVRRWHTLTRAAHEKGGRA